MISNSELTQQLNGINKKFYYSEATRFFPYFRIDQIWKTNKTN